MLERKEEEFESWKKMQKADRHKSMNGHTVHWTVPVFITCLFDASSIMQHDIKQANLKPVLVKTFYLFLNQYQQFAGWLMWLEMYAGYMLDRAVDWEDSNYIWQAVHRERHCVKVTSYYESWLDVHKHCSCVCFFRCTKSTGGAPLSGRKKKRRPSVSHWHRAPVCSLMYSLVYSAVYKHKTFCFF